MYKFWDRSPHLIGPIKPSAGYKRKMNKVHFGTSIYICLYMHIIMYTYINIYIELKFLKNVQP